jgi:hypothetical protein
VGGRNVKARKDKVSGNAGGKESWNTNGKGCGRRREGGNGKGARLK